MTFSPFQIAIKQRFPVGTVIALGQTDDGPKAEISGWTIHTYPKSAQPEDGNETGLCFFLKGESGDCPPCPAAHHKALTLGEYNFVGGFDSQENSLSTDDYPYGRLRCTARGWVETAEKGAQKGKQRFMQQTINPKDGRVNKPVASVYCDMQVMYVEGSTGHVKNYAFETFYGPDGLLKFITTGLYAQIDAATKARLKALVDSGKRCRINGGEWSKGVILMKLARERFAGTFTEDDAKAICDRFEAEHPSHRVPHWAEAECSFKAVAKEKETGVVCDLI